MINLVQIKPEGRDGTTWYNILLPPNYTVGHFVKDVLKQYKDCWGVINIEKDGYQIDTYSYEYGKFKLKSILKQHSKDKKIISAKANGGYSNMNFILTISD